MLGSATSGRGAVTAVRVGVATARAQKGRRAADAFEARRTVNAEVFLRGG
jgi:hypothetical protein